ncbi:pancreatic triacylglycerol lipase-like [Dendropsophus ebraccatus]|uniref:pancreatic triacylglycerol lipase-like n=1 Tax=Dendropsophus ebraccatus TaxID=150705 RepID=UPI00383233F1
MVLAVLMFLYMAVCVQGETRCYDDIGCVSNDPPYWSLTRSVSIFPQSPEEINTQFFLFTRNNIDQYQVVSARDLSTIQNSSLDCSRKSVFIIHGFTDRGDSPWMVDMCRTLLQVENVNCLCVDWSGGSSAIYLQAMNNIQVVGAEVAYFINTIVDNLSCSLSGIHIIGHSLGAHTAGEAGKRRPGIARITCLDAARPGFEGESDVVSVDRSDADFVAAIHSDAGVIGAGMTQLIGHKDFFPNGGSPMTGCGNTLFSDLGELQNLTEAVRNNIACNHVASYYMLTASILNPSGFMGYCATSYSSFQGGAGFPCSSGSCSLMGYYTEPGDASSCRVYYLNTGPRFNYERWRYRVTVQTGGNVYTIGSISVTLYTSDSDNINEINSGPIIGGQIYSGFIDSPLRPPIVRVTFNWNSVVPLNPFFNPTLWAKSVTLTYGIDGAEYKFCVLEATKKNTPQPLDPCP